MKYFFETYGCQMNKAESASVEQLFMNRGWQDAGCAEEADFIVINTCSVRATAESRIAGRLGWYTTLRRERQKSGTGDFTLVVTGCMAERLKEDLKKQFKVVDYVVGTFQHQHFVELIEAAEKKTAVEYMDEEPVYSFAPLSYEKGAFQAYVPIMHGCNNFCTYCIVPYVRGREVSRNPDDIMKELDMLSERGVKEVTLLGQNVNSYMWKNTDKSDVAGEENSSAIDFPELMQRIADHLRETSSSIGWVRFMSSHPKDISERLIDVIAKESVMCRHIHLPVQHGSTRILQLMNRKYTREDYLAKVRMIRSKLPGVSLTTDIMLGFPGETDEDFEQAVSLLQEVKYEAAFMYYYNPREGTKACSMPDQIPMEVKKKRLAKVIDIQLAINRAEMSKRVGTTTKVLVECVSKDNENELLGRTEQDEHVVFAADKSLIGSFVEVKLIELTGNTFKGTL
ncbi:MAG: tRNA (N6-isopentenyl adenosine(37)-C2)-methylthiotransferase MiaB [Treponemataceae bacterium]|nr:tRNA (N6-isopentenyl adenosine(37)-C2)-methylthiotransferase MiaB [Treponemataceae bacterium]